MRYFTLDVIAYVFAGCIERFDVMRPALDEFRIRMANRTVRYARLAVHYLIERTVTEHNHFREESFGLRLGDPLRADHMNTLSAFTTHQLGIQFPLHIRGQWFLNNAYSVEEGMATLVVLDDIGQRASPLLGTEESQRFRPVPAAHRRPAGVGPLFEVLAPLQLPGITAPDRGVPFPEVAAVISRKDSLPVICGERGRVQVKHQEYPTSPR